MSKLQIVKPQHSLLYAMKWLPNMPLEDWQHEQVQVPGPQGDPVPLVVHMISGTKEEIRQQLLESIDAFFELSEEIK